MYILMLIPSIVLAEDDGSYDSIAKLVEGLLDAIAWFGYAIALGALIFLGIKYVMSGAQERASLKGKFIMYVIGIALIVLCATIAAAVAEIANQDGQTTPENLVDLGFQIAGIQVGTSSGDDESDDGDDGTYKVTTVSETGPGEKIIKTYDKNGNLLEMEIYDLDDNLLSERKYGRDSFGREYSYQNPTFNDGTPMQNVYTGLQALDIVSKTLDDYTIGGLTSVSSNISEQSSTYTYTVPIYNDGGEVKGSYDISVTDWENGFRYMKVDLMDGGEKAGSVEYKINNDTGDVRTIQLLDSDGGKIGDAIEWTKGNTPTQDIRDTMETFYKGPKTGIFNDK